MDGLINSLKSMNDETIEGNTILNAFCNVINAIKLNDRFPYPTLALSLSFGRFQSNY